MLISKDNLYIHMPVQRLIKDLDRFLSLNLNCEVLITSAFIDNHSTEDMRLIKEGFKKRGLSLRVHGPFIDLNPGSADKDIRQFSSKRFLQALKLSSEFGSAAMVLHSHYEPVFYRNHFDLWLENSDQAWQPLCKQARENNITICIENSLDDEPRAVISILKKYPAFKACLDVAHYNVFCDSKIEDILSSYPRGCIGEVHLSDNKGDQDSHLALGEGDIDFDKVMKALEGRGEKPVFTIEPHSEEGLLKGLEYIKRFMK